MTYHQDSANEMVCWILGSNGNDSRKSFLISASFSVLLQFTGNFVLLSIERHCLADTAATAAQLSSVRHLNCSHSSLFIPVCRLESMIQATPTPTISPVGLPMIPKDKKLWGRWEGGTKCGGIVVQWYGQQDVEDSGMWAYSAMICDWFRHSVSWAEKFFPSDFTNSSGIY